MSYREFTYDEIAEIFSYDPEEGELCRRLVNGESGRLQWPGKTVIAAPRWWPATRPRSACAH